MISIIIPTYNEAGNIAILINQISRILKGEKHEIIVIDDDSPDKTWQVVKELQRKNSSIKLYRRLNQRGLTTALNYGIGKSHGEIIGWLDADLSHPPRLLPLMAKYIKQYDAVIASRYIKGAKDNRGIFVAVLFSRIINLLAQAFLFKDLTDYTSGYILVKKKHLSSIILKGDYGEYFIDLLFKLKKSGAKIKEVPYISVARIHGQSKTATSFFGFIKRGYKYLFTIIKLWLKKF